MKTDNRVLYFSLNPKSVDSFYSFIEKTGLDCQSSFRVVDKDLVYDKGNGNALRFKHATDLLYFLNKYGEDEDLGYLYVIIDYPSFFKEHCSFVEREKTNELESFSVKDAAKTIRRAILQYPEVFFMFDESWNTGNPPIYPSFLFYFDEKNYISNVWTEYHKYSVKEGDNPFDAILRGRTGLFDGSNLRYAIKRFEYDILKVERYNFSLLQDSRAKNLCICVEEERSQNRFNSYALFTNGYRVLPVFTSKELKCVNENAANLKPKLIVRDYDLQFPDVDDMKTSLDVQDKESYTIHTIDYIRGAKYIKKKDNIANGLNFIVTDEIAQIGEDYTLPELTNPNKLEVTWTSSDKNVATIGDSSEIKLVAPGKTLITASFAGNENFIAGKAIYNLTVIERNRSKDIIISPNKLAFCVKEIVVRMKMGESFTPPALTNPNNLEVTWTSSDTNVATIGGSSEIRLIASGKTLITASFAGNENFIAGSASYNLIVIDNSDHRNKTHDERTAANKLAFSVQELLVKKEMENVFIPPALTNPNNLEVTWTSSDTNVATIGDSSEIKLIASGKTLITASFAGNEKFIAGKASYTLIVTDKKSETSANEKSSIIYNKWFIPPYNAEHSYWDGLLKINEIKVFFVSKGVEGRIRLFPSTAEYERKRKSKLKEFQITDIGSLVPFIDGVDCQFVNGTTKPVSGLYTTFQLFETIEKQYDSFRIGSKKQYQKTHAKKKKEKLDKIEKDIKKAANDALVLKELAVKENTDDARRKAREKADEVSRLTDKKKQIEKTQDWYINTSRENHEHGVPLDIYDSIRNMLERARKYYDKGKYIRSAIISSEVIELLNGFHEALVLQAYHILAISENALAMNTIGGNEDELGLDASFRITKIADEVERLIDREREDCKISQFYFLNKIYSVYKTLLIEKDDRRKFKYNVLNQIYSECRTFCKEREHFKAEDRFISAMAHVNEGYSVKDIILDLKEIITKVLSFVHQFIHVIFYAGKN